MHECISESAFLADAEVDSMRGVIDGGVDTGTKATPCRVEIEKVQEEIRLEINCREERLRELEFLEKGGDPLDFNFSHTVSVSVQSTSLTDQHPEQIVNSKAKDSCASTALRLRHEENVESFGKPEDTNCESDSGVSLLLFDGKSKLIRDKNSKSRVSKNTAATSDFSIQNEGTHKPRGAENSAIFRPYARRNRSKSNRDVARSASMDVVLPQSQNKQASTHFRAVTRKSNGKDQKLASLCKLKSSDRISGDIHKNDSIRNVVSVELPTEEKLTNTLHGGQKEHAIDAKSNGDLFGSRNDHEKPREPTSCSAGIGAEERVAVTSYASHLSDATTNTQHTCAPCQTNGLELSKRMNFTQNDGDTCVDRVNEDSNEKYMEPVLVSAEDNKPITEGPQEVKTNPDHVDPGPIFIGGNGADHDFGNCSIVKVESDDYLEKRSMTPGSSMTIKLKVPEVDQHHMIDHKCETTVVETLTKGPLDEVVDTVPSPRDANDNNVHNPDACNKQLTDKMDEDSILAEANIIQAKRKWIAELSMKSSHLEKYRKSHWDFLLEEMTWLANDFKQERLWKITASDQISRHTAMFSHLREQKQMPVRRMKFVAHSMAKAVMEFWNISELLVNDSSNSICEIIAPVSAETEAIEDHVVQKGSNLSEPQSPCKSFALRSYALKFLRYNSSTVPSVEAEGPTTSNNMHDIGMQETSAESCITQDDLFYALPPTAMECYRSSIESYVAQCEKNGSLENVDDTTIHDANDGEEMSQEIGYGEDEGETSALCLPGTVEWSKSSKFPNKKQKGLKGTYTSGSYDMAVDLAYGIRTSGTQIERLASQNVVSIPTKRMRTASRQRVLGSSSGVDTVNMRALNKTDASSGDTNSYQNDQSYLPGGSQLRSLEVESSADFGKYLPVDSGEISTKQKKKKAKNRNSSYEQRSLYESAIRDDMGGHSKRRLDSHHIDSNGSNGLFGQQRNKKLKVLLQKSENVLDYGAGSMLSPATSQMSNMPNGNEYERVVPNWDHMRQAKVTKLSIPMSGSGTNWTSFEEQALVVLVHDLGPNWELVSHVFNSTLQFKRIFRGPKECKEKHKMLIDQTAGDGADSAVDSGSSRPYASTMPGIPKGSARQLFQRLHAPMEHDTVKSHFQKIIMIGRKQYHLRKQLNSHDQKHVTPHNSHMFAVSPISQNNLDGGSLTPLDHIDAMISSPDGRALYQSPHSNGFNNQISLPSVLPPPGANSIYEGSIGTNVGNSISSPSGPTSHRNGRYNVSRTFTATDDKQRIQQLNPMFTSGNIQQSTMPVSRPHSLANHFGAHSLQDGNGISMVNGINSRGMPMSRPGFQGLSSPATLSPEMVGMPSLRIQSATSQGNSLHRPMDNSHQIRPGQSLVRQRQMVVPKLQMRASQAISGLSASAGPSSAPPYSQQAHLRAPNNAVGPQHPAYARLVKERQRQQQVLQHQQPFSASNSMMSQAQRHLPVSMQNSAQLQPQSSLEVSHSSPSPLPSSLMTPMNSQLQQKHHLPPHGLIRDSQSGVTNLPG